MLLANLPKDILFQEIIARIKIADVINLLKVDKSFYVYTDVYRKKIQTNKTCVVKKLEYWAKQSFLTKEDKYLINYLNDVTINIPFVKFLGVENYQMIQNNRQVRYCDYFKDKIISISHLKVHNFVTKHHILEQWNELIKYLKITDTLIPVGIIKHLHYKRRSLDSYSPANTNDYFEDGKKYGKALLAFATNSGNFYYLAEDILYIIANVANCDRVNSFENIWEWCNC